jgi:hypothetical protein
MPLGLLKFIEPNGKEIYITCQDIPPQDGTPGSLLIENVSIKIGTRGDGSQYLFLSLPRTDENALPPVSDENKLEVQLTENVTEDHLVLPFNGGIPDQEVSVKLLNPPPII